MLDLIGRAFGTAVGWGVFALGCIVWGVLVVPVALLVAALRPGTRERFADLTRSALRLYVRILPFVRFEVMGRELRCPRPCVVVVNHQSRLDPIVMMALEPRLSGPARRYLLRTPVLGSILRLGDFYAAELGEPAPLERMGASGRNALARSGALLFFPEGTRSMDGEIGGFHRGAFRVAVDAGLPIQPVLIEGLDRVLPPDTWIPRTRWRYPVWVRYLSPLHPPYGDGPRRSVVRALSDSVRDLMVEELERLRAERKTLEGSRL